MEAKLYAGRWRKASKGMSLSFLFRFHFTSTIRDKSHFHRARGRTHTQTHTDININFNDFAFSQQHLGHTKKDSHNSYRGRKKAGRRGGAGRTQQQSLRLQRWQMLNLNLNEWEIEFSNNASPPLPCVLKHFAHMLSPGALMKGKSLGTVATACCCCCGG